MLSHEGIRNCQSSHSLNDRDRARDDIRVVTALGGQDALSGRIVASGSLVLGDGGRGLERNTEEDGHAVGDATLDTTRVVRLGV